MEERNLFRSFVRFFSFLYFNKISQGSVGIRHENSSNLIYFIILTWFTFLFRVICGILELYVCRVLYFFGITFGTGLYIRVYRIYSLLKMYRY